MFDRGFQLGDGIFETLRARGGRLTELAEHVARLRRSAAGLDIELPDDARRAARGGASPTLLAAEDLDGPDGDASIRITVTRGAWASRGLLPPRDERSTATIVIQAWPVVPAPADAPRATASTSSRRRCAATRPNPIVTLKTTSRADYVFARLEARRAGADDALFLTRVRPPLRVDDRERVPRPAGRPTACRSSRRPSLDCAILPGHDALVAAALGEPASGLRPVEGWLTPDELATARRGVRVLVGRGRAARHPVQRHRRSATGGPGPWTLRARADREGFIVGG